MRQSSKRILSILLSAVFVVGSIVVFTTLIRPELNRAMEMRNELFSKEQTLSNQKQAVNTVESMIEDVRGNNQLRDVLSLAMPRDREETNIMNQINAISQGAGVQISSISVEQGDSRPSGQPLVRPLGIINIGLNVAGQYGDVRDFLRMLESNVRIFNIKESSLSSSIQDEEMFVSASLSFNAYFQQSGGDSNN